MSNWTTEQQPFGPNHTPLLTGTSSADGITPVPVAVNPLTGEVEVTDVSTGILPGVLWDEVVGTDEDANGNPQVMTFKKSGNTVAVVDATYNSSSKLTHLLRVS